METSSLYFTFSTGMVKYSQEIALENATKLVHRNIYLETDSSVDKKEHERYLLDFLAYYTLSGWLLFPTPPPALWRDDRQIQVVYKLDCRM